MDMPIYLPIYNWSKTPHAIGIVKNIFLSALIIEDEELNTKKLIT